MKNKLWFQKSLIAVTALFFGIMFFVITKAYMRKSGSTGLDVVKIHQMRVDGLKQTAFKEN